MWTHEMFGIEKPIIALLHLDALPGDPGYCGSMDTVLDHARQDLIALQNGEIDVCIDPPINELQYLEEDENITVEEKTGSRLFYFAKNDADSSQTAPFFAAVQPSNVFADIAGSAFIPSVSLAMACGTAICI